MVGTPCFGGHVTALYAGSLLKLQQACIERGLNFGVLLESGDSLITRARQTIVAHFLGHPHATHLLFVDADIGFEPEQVFRLLHFNADFTAAAYPVKQIDWDMVPQAVQAGRKPLESATLNYVIEGDTANGLLTRDGFVKARCAGTGFLMIRRAALLSMIARYPELRYTRDLKANDPLKDSPWRCALFNCMIDEETGIYLSEDYSFCRRWTGMGGEIWVDFKSRLQHIGPMIFRGDLAARVDLPAE